MKAIDWALIGQGEKRITRAAVHQLKYASHSQYTAGIFSPLINCTSPDTAEKLVNILLGMPHHEKVHLDLKWNRNDITFLPKEHWDTTEVTEKYPFKYEQISDGSKKYWEVGFVFDWGAKTRPLCERIIWPWKTVGHWYATSSFVHHFIATSEFDLTLQSENP